MTESGTRSTVLTLVFTDLADSTLLKSERGDAAVDALLSRHRGHVTRLAGECAGRVVDWAGDGCFLTFETSSAAVMFALRLQQAHATEKDLPGVRIGVHLGEITESVSPDGSPQVKGLAVDVAARVQGLAKPGQVLMSAPVYENARQRLGVEAFGDPILWRVHGSYKLKGVDKAYEISEAGIKGVSPMAAPKVGDKARRVRRWNKGADAASHAVELPETIRRFRIVGYVLVGLAFVLLYTGLVWQQSFAAMLGFMLAAFFGGIQALIAGRAMSKHRQKDGGLEKLRSRFRGSARAFLGVGLCLVALGVLLSPLAGNETLYVLAMIGVPFCAVGTVQIATWQRLKAASPEATIAEQE